MISSIIIKQQSSYQTHWNDATEIVYDTQSRRLTKNPQKFQKSVIEASVAGDIDGDGDIDFITPKQLVSVIVLNNQSSWTQIPLPDTIVTTNATIADFKNNGEINLLANPQYEDGDPTTLDGDIGYRAISSAGLGSPNLSPLTLLLCQLIYFFQILTKTD